MRVTAGPTAALVGLAALVLAGCSATAEPAPSASPAATPAATAPATARPATPSPAPDAAPAMEVPEECDALSLSGETLAGADLGDCLQAVLVRADTGTLTLSGDEIGGTVVYHYDPRFEFRGDLETGDGPAAISFVDDVMMLDDGNGPVVADVGSSVSDEHTAGATGEIYRVFADPGFMSDLIGEGAAWSVVASPEQVTLEDGSTVLAHRIDSTEPYSWYDIPVEQFTLWVTEDWQPVAAESTTSFLGRPATVRQEFSDLGGDVLIAPLA